MVRQTTAQEEENKKKGGRSLYCTCVARQLTGRRGIGKGRTLVKWPATMLAFFGGMEKKKDKKQQKTRRLVKRSKRGYAGFSGSDFRCEVV